MLLAEGITIEPGWVVAGVTVLGSSIAFVFKLLISSKDQQIEDLKTRNKILDSLTQESLASLLETVNFYRGKENKPPITPLVAVVPNSNSPSTVKQRAEADIETKKATLTAIKLAMHQEPRPTPPEAFEQGAGRSSTLPTVAAEVREHTKKLDEKVDEVAADVKDIKQVVVAEDKATPKGRTG